MADSCKGSDSDGIDNRYHKKFSDEDWEPGWRIISSHFVDPDSTLFPQWRSRIYSSPAKVIARKEW